MGRDDVEKPPYRVPLMSELGDVELSGYVSASTFSGCGGSSLGHRMAGFDVRYANEFIPAARECYLANFPDTVVDDRDVRDVEPKDVLEACRLDVGELDLLDGSPPCSSFSTAGKRSAGWGKAKLYSEGVRQRTDDLFFEFVRLVASVQPRVFVAENVSGLVKGVAKGYFLEILDALRGAGYEVEARLLDAQWLGVPQARQRLIFVGVRNDLAREHNVHPAYPRPLPYRYSVREAIPWLTAIGKVPGGDYDKKGSGHVWVGPDDPCSTITASNGNRVPMVESPIGPAGDGPSIEKTCLGPEAKKLGPGEASDRYFNLVRADADGPSPTVTASAGSSAGTAGVVHPNGRRKFTIAELRRVCSFPDDFVLTGSYGQQWERLGRAVPPLMMRAIAQTVRTEILDRCAP